jgi:hypothetical protein
MEAPKRAQASLGGLTKNIMYLRFPKPMSKNLNIYRNFFNINKAFDYKYLMNH